MKKIIFILTIFLLAMYGCEKYPEAPINDIAIADKVSASTKTATISGTVECPVSITKIELWIDTIESSAYPKVYTVEMKNKNFAFSVTGLLPITTYYYRYVAYNSVDTLELEEKNFTTMDGTLASITTAEVTSITANTAVCGGNVTSDGYLSVTSRGVCWSTSPNPTISNSKTTDGSGTGSFTSNITGLADGTTYYVRAYATNSKGTAYGEEKSFTTPSLINGRDWVDLGLPSGLKWATCNVGASQPHEYGNFYAWGETTTKTSYSSSNSVTSGQQMSDISGNVAYDAARANWGSPWRMPTKAEMEELRDNCTWTWTTQNGVNGYRVTGTNGNSIFLPAAGDYENELRHSIGTCVYYWGSTPADYGDSAFRIEDESYSHSNCNVDTGHRFHGHSVRPVSE